MKAVLRSAAILAAVLMALSAAALALIASTVPVPSLLRDPLWCFVQPGTALWWLTLGGPFQTGPATLAGVAFAATANAALWLACGWVVRALCRLAQRLAGAYRD